MWDLLCKSVSEICHQLEKWCEPKPGNSRFPFKRWLAFDAHLSSQSDIRARPHHSVLFRCFKELQNMLFLTSTQNTTPTALCIKLPHLSIDGMSQGISHKLIVWMATAIFTFSSWILINWLLDVSKALQHTHGTHWGGWCFKNWFCYLVEKFAEIC